MVTVPYRLNEPLKVTPLSFAQRFVGLKELPGEDSNPLITGMLRLDHEWPEGDDVPWCSAFVNFIAWCLDLPRSKSLRARSWLTVGQPVRLEDAEPGFDVVVLSRGRGDPPGPTVLNAPGHVAFFVSHDKERGLIDVLGGNQGNHVSVQAYPTWRLLGVRRL